MSYINDALRKAQLDKDSRYGQYGDVVVATTSPRRGGQWKRFFIFVVIAAIVTFFALYAVELKGIVGMIRPPEPVKPVVPAPPPPPDVNALCRTALELQKKGQLGEAGQIYRQILSIQAIHADALNNLGVVYMQEGKLVDALGMFNRAVEAKPDNAEPYYNLACIQARMKNRPLSLEYLKKAIAINPVVKAWAKEDHDLKNLKKNSEFKRITQ